MMLLCLLAFAAASVVANAVVDDHTCHRSSGGCEPKSLCEYNYNFGDLSFDQSCRVKDGVNFYPQQIHLAFAGIETGTAMAVSWATFEDVTDSSVWVGRSEDTLALVDTLVSSDRYYSDDEYNLFHHHATITGLKPHTKYFYKFVRHARAATDDSTFNVLIYGDLGDGENSVDTIAAVNNMTSDEIDLVYHLGDISYADNDFLEAKQAAGFCYEEVYNKWMNSMMPLMSRVPYMVLVGNHEAECHSPRCQASRSKSKALGNYTAYNTRLKMPYEESSGTSNMWHSLDHGPIHFTSLSTESDYPNAPANAFTIWTKNGNFGDQLSWIEADLKKADANRENTAKVQAAFEDLLLKYKVDVVLTGHKHYYERHLPIASPKAVLDGVSEDFKVYENPQAPVHILSGGAGQSEGLSFSPKHTSSWNAV
ncbi:Calcineurin-like phosphoesterase [Phytophthora infestans]|uniref:Purple acid phosphatase n=1 Tax=Phytophthora infestans TaxID=4787 RepID=A0A8S9U6J4_PHYIN|nr:Calcineurin-like phosphoesterase [Phytophthora infestans]